VKVHHEGDTPALFKPGVPVVCEGRWRGNTFASDRILIKHDSNYTPKQQVNSVTTVTVEPQR
jgi:cytochrome c-type biogenesis protein CcmE